MSILEAVAFVGAGLVYTGVVFVVGWGKGYDYGKLDKNKESL